MKRLLILLFAILLYTLSFSQIQRTETTEFIKIGEFKNGPMATSLKFSIIDNDTTYYLLFQNAEYRTVTDIKSFMFQEEGGTLDTLYKLLTEALKLDKGKKINFKLGADDISVISDAIMGAKYINILRPSDGSYFTCTQRQLKKLFNR